MKPSWIYLSFGLVALLCPAAQGADPNNPVKSAWSAPAAARYLDERATWWFGWSGAARGRGTFCVSCHTAVPLALARPALGVRLGEKGPGALENRLLDNLTTRVEHWSEITTPSSVKERLAPFYTGKRKPSALGTEAVLNALLLVSSDVRRSSGRLSAATRKALDHLWEQQQEDGAWLWLDFGLRPWETEAVYYGASLAALAVGMAGKDYQEQPGVRPHALALKKYLKAQFPKQALHHRIFALLASTQMPDLLTEQDRQRLIDEVFSVQEADGGWSLPRLGRKPGETRGWESHGIYPQGITSDGYATGLVVLALKRAGIGREHPGLQKAIAWLGSNEREGTWPAIYPNRPRNPQDDTGKFMRDAATAFALLALTE